MNDKAMYQLTYGLFVLSSTGSKDNACIINTAGQVTATPNRVSFAVNKTNFTHDLIKESGLYTLSVISEAADFSLFKRFGFASGADTDKFADYTAVTRLKNQTLAVTEGTNAYLSGTIFQTIDLGTHTLFVGDVTDMDVLSEVASATYAYYHAHIKPKPEEKPPAGGKTIWRCTICGYEYEGETLPEDFICPWCKHPASDFEKVTE